MDKYLIVNADDFGLHPHISAGVEKTIQYGIVKSISFIVNTEAFRGSMEIIRRYPEVSIGIHLNLTDGKPVSNANKFIDLLNKNGNFRGSHLKTIYTIISHTGYLPAIKEEFEAQIRKLRENGIKITHIDSHGHIHMLPQLFTIVTELAREFRIPFVRLSDERLQFSSFSREPGILALNLLAPSAARILKKFGVKKTDYFIGMSNAGRVSLKQLSTLCLRIKHGVTELAVHPREDETVLSHNFKWGYRWDEERLALTDSSVREAAEKNHINLVNFSQIL